MQAAHAPDSVVGRMAATIDRLRKQIEQAQLAAEGRALIELARGVLVERLRCGPAQAARQLAALAERAGISELELAADVVNQAAQDRVSEVAREFLARTGPGEAGDPSVAVRLRTAESGMLDPGSDSQRVAESLLEHALAPLRANMVALWVAGPDASLTLAAYAGVSAEEAHRWRYVPPAVATPARRALEERQPVRFRTLGEAGLPSIGYRRLPDGGRMAVPTGTGGRILGVLEVGWPYPLAPQPAGVLRQLEALAELCAHTLETPVAPEDAAHGLAELIDLADALPDPALVLRPHVDDAGQLADFRIHHVNDRFTDPAGRPRGTVAGALLLEAYPLIGAELLEKIEHVHATGEPFRAEGMTLTALVDQVPLTSVADISLTRHGACVLVIWRAQDEAVRLARLLQHAQRLGRIGGFEEDVATGRITWNENLYALYGLEPGDPPIPIDRLGEHAHPDDAVGIGRFLRTVLHHRRAATAAFRLRRDDGITRHIRVVAEPGFAADGRMIAIRGVYQDISAQHWTEVALAATRDRLEASEQESRERNRLALRLQHAIMPPARGPVEALGLRIAVRYRPAEAEHLVGGDWYDTVILPSKQVLLSVGDVAGHGIEAATGMVTLRNALRGLAATGAGPGRLLTWLNLVAHHLTENVTATAICALFDPETRTLRWARGGHLPPILLRDGKATELPSVDGLLLGAMSDAGYEEGELVLEEDDILLMYTDGLIERRDSTLEHSQFHLCRTAEEAAGGLDQRLDHLLTHSLSDTDDDTCLIAVQLR